jgi:hypothetical protein
MIRKILLFLAFYLFFTGAQAQQTYNTALGMRINGGLGVTVKHMLNDKAAIEGILYTRWGGLNLTGIYAVHYPVFKEPGFRFYIGGGSHLGFFDGNENPWWDDNDQHGVWGIDGQIGLEYTFDEIPLNLSLDWKPAINIIGSDDIWYGDAGLSVRYTWK